MTEGNVPSRPRLLLVEEQYALRAFKSGANGYVTKDSAAAELVAAVCRSLPAAPM